MVDCSQENINTAHQDVDSILPFLAVARDESYPPNSLCDFRKSVAFLGIRKMHMPVPYWK